MRRPVLAAFALVTASCASVPPAPPVQRTGTDVAAPFGKVWDAVIDDFARQNIAIRTMDRASGFISAEPMRVSNGDSGRQPHPMADCGQLMMGMYNWPTMATYNVLVRGDSTRAVVRTTVRWTTPQANTVNECSTKGVWESRFEADVKARAEGRPVPSAATQSR